MEDTFDTVSTRGVLNTTGKDTTMLLFIFSFLLFVILLCALWFHDVWYPPEGRAEKKKWSRSLDRIEGGNKHNNQHVCRAAPPIKPREASVVGISPVSRRKVIPMTISQQMILLFNQTREV